MPYKLIPFLNVLFDFQETWDHMLSELKLLKNFQENHRHCKKGSKFSETPSDQKTLTKDGAGCSNGNPSCDPCDEDTCGPSENGNCNCESTNDSFNPDLTSILPQEPPKVDSKVAEDVPLPSNLVISKLWKRHQFKGSQLLTSLERSGQFKIDHNSMVFVNNVPLNISIFNLMKLTFQPVKSNLQKLEPYTNLLKDFNLQKYVTNKYLLVDDNTLPIVTSKYWYYLGS